MKPRRKVNRRLQLLQLRDRGRMGSRGLRPAIELKALRIRQLRDGTLPHVGDESDATLTDPLEDSKDLVMNLGGRVENAH